MMVMAEDVTERLRVEKAIRESEEKYRLLAENISDVIWIIDIDTMRFRYVSPSVYQMRGYTAEEVMAMDALASLTPDSQRIFAEQMPSLLENYNRGERVSYISEVEQPCKDGSTVTIEVTTRIIHNDQTGHLEIYGVSRNITERKRVEKELIESETRYRLIFNSAAQGIITADPKTMKLRFVNPAMCRIFGYSEEEFSDLSVPDLHPAESLPEIISAFKSMYIGEITSANAIPCIRKDGSLIFTDISSSTILMDNKIFLIGFFIDVTERVKSRKLLEKSEEQYRNLIENSHDIIQSVDSTGRFIFVNRRWHKLLGYDDNDIKTMNLFDIIHPDSQEKCRDEFKRIIAGEQNLHLNLVMIARNGNELEFEGSAVQQRLENGEITTNAFFIDATQRNRLERIKSMRLAVTNIISKFGSIEQSIGDVIASIGTTGRWECGELWWYNRSGDFLTQRQSWVLHDKPELTAFILKSGKMVFKHDEGLPGHTQQNKRVIWCSNIEQEKIFKRKEIASNAGIKSAVAIPIIDNDNPIAVMNLFGSRDRPPENDMITALGEIGIQLGMFISRKKLEAELEEERYLLAHRVEERTAELNEATIAAESASRAKSDFLASMSHELRTPLNSVIGFSELMLNGMAGEMSADQKEYLGDILDSGRHLLSLINDILDLSKVEAGKMELEVSGVSIKDVLGTVRSLFKEKAMRHGIIFNIDSVIPDRINIIHADGRKLKQILLNLVSNAVKFTPDGGQVDIRADLTSDSGIDYIRFMVKDSGIGISAENQKRLFIPFQQLDNTSTRKYAGTGLGLSLCRAYTELHGGTIWVESEVNMGATFFFTIPLLKNGNHI